MARRPDRRKRRLPARPSPPDLAAAPSWTRADLLIGAGVGLAAFSLYLATLCPTIYTSGAGENATAVLTLGVPHPPGFPLFCLVGKLFTVLVPLGGPAWRVNLFSAVCGAAAVSTLHGILRSTLGAQARVAAATGALLFAASRTFWSQAVIAEVYTLNVLLQLLALVAALEWTRGAKLWPLGLAVGLGIAVHPLSVLFAPAWIAVMLGSGRRPATREAAKAVACAGLGVALHLYAPLRARARPILNWGDPSSFPDFVAYITAAQYRGRMFGVHGPEVLRNVSRALSQLASDMTPWLLPLPIVGAWLLWRQARGLVLGTAIAAAATFVYAVNYDIPWEIEVYFIPVVLVMAIWSGGALAWMGTRAGPALPLLALLPVLLNYRANDRSSHAIAEAYGHDILASAPPNATVVAPETDAAFALLYFTAVMGERPDVRVWIRSTEGAKPIERALSPAIPPLPLERLVAESRGPVLLCDPLPPKAGLGLKELPHGVLYQVASATVSQARSATFDFSEFALEAIVRSGPAYYLDDRSRVILARYLFARGDAHRSTGRIAEARADYDAAVARAPNAAEIFIELASREESMGDMEAAIQAVRRSLALREDALVTNRLGRLLIDVGRREEALGTLRRALELDPTLAIAHSNLGGLLGMAGDAEGAIRELETAVRLDPRSTKALRNLGQAYLMAGNRDRAIQSLREALAVDPSQREIVELLARIEAER